MYRRSLYTTQTTTESNSIERSFTDLMSNAFMILSFLLLLVLFQAQKLNQDLKKSQKSSQNLQEIQERNKELEELRQLNSKEIQQLKQTNERLQSSAFIIIDENSGNFKFKSGSAELSPKLKSHIDNKISPEIFLKKNPQ